MTLNGNSDETNGYNSVIKNGATANVNLVKAVIPPIGAVLPWFKTFANVPALPDGWVECDGTAISDADSPMNGQTLPDLNGDNAFLNGNSTSWASGAKDGGEDTHVLTTAELASHSHDILAKSTGSGGTNVQQTVATAGGSTESTETAGSGTAHENRPPFYNVVFIMRVK